MYKNHNDYIVQAIKNNPGQILKIYRENSREFSEILRKLEEKMFLTRKMSSFFACGALK